MNSLRAGVVCFERLRLDRPLPNGADCQLWLATDLRTDSLHAVEFLPPGAIASADIIHRPHSSLLSFYRLEVAESAVAAVFAFHPLLDAPAISTLASSRLDPTIAFEWFVSIAEAVRSLHETGCRAHGAVVPSRIRAEADRALLTGYPYANDLDVSSERAFISPQRRGGNTHPAVADDVFGLAAVAYFLFTGGLSPPLQSTGLASGKHDIETVRRERGLTPTTWRSDWDRPLLAALAGISSLRPDSVQSLMDALAASLGRRLDRQAPRVASFAPRRLPAWRLEHLSTTASLEDTPRSNSSSAVSLHALEKIREEMAQLQRLRAELDRRQELLATDVIQIENSREVAECKAAEIQAERTTLAHAVAKLGHARVELDLARTGFEAERNEFEQTKMARLAEREKHLNDYAAKLEKERACVDQRDRALDAKEATLMEDASALRLAEHNLATKCDEFEQRQSSFLEAQRDWTELCGSSDPQVWKTFVSKFVPTSEPVPSPSFDLSHRLPVVNADKETSAATASSTPEASAKASLLFPDGRQLNVYSGRIVRFGRHAQSDFLLVAVLHGQRQPNLSLLREISRKHFEIHVGDVGVKVEDGWSDEGKPSQHGICVDGRRVPNSGAELRDGALLSVTTRAPGRSLPHWRVTLIPKNRGASAAEGRSTNSQASSAKRPLLSAVYLHRLDDAPGDVCVLLDSVSLRDIGVSNPAYRDAALSVSSAGIVWNIGQHHTLLTEGSSPLEGISVAPSGWISPAVSPSGSE